MLMTPYSGNSLFPLNCNYVIGSKLYKYQFKDHMHTNIPTLKHILPFPNLVKT